LSIAPVRSVSTFFERDKQALEANLARLQTVVDALAKFYCFGIISDDIFSSQSSSSSPVSNSGSSGSVSASSGRFRCVPVFSEEGAAYFHYLITTATSLSMRIRTAVLDLRQRMHATVQVRMPMQPVEVEEAVQAQPVQQGEAQVQPQRGLLERVKSGFARLLGGGEKSEAELTAIITQTEGLIDTYQRLKIKAEVLGSKYAEWCREQLRTECTKVIPELYRRTNEYIRARLALMLNQEFAMTMRS
jgi:hypothetical protein